MKSRKKIRVAVIGVGYLGKLHAEKYSMLEEAELVGVTDTNEARAREIASDNSTKAYPSYTDFFGKVDAVSIVTPTESHFRIGREFLSRGIDVMMEKPIALDSKEAGELVKEAERKGAILQVGHLERFNGAIQALNGRVKDPVFAEAYRHSAFPNRGTDVDVILDLMIHDIDIVLNLVKSDIEGVDAVGVPVVSGRADVCKARLRFKNGCVANLSASRVSKERVRKLNILQRGEFFYVDYAAQHLSHGTIVPGKDGGTPSFVEEDIKIEKKDSLLEELKSFLSSSASRKAPAVTGADGMRALEVAERIQASVRDSSVRFLAGLEKATC